jgi:TadE-like protein/PA14 domain
MTRSNRRVNTDPRYSQGKPRRRGQSLVEFALTLPILLLLIFGIIEFGRLFQAWVTIQNAARTAIRYAVTGQYDQAMFPNMDADWTPGVGPGPGGVQGDGIPCPYSESDALQTAFKTHWDGITCRPGDDNHQWMRRDILRLMSITEVARVGAAGLALAPDNPDIPGTAAGTSPGIGAQTYDDVLKKAETERGWFHVWICSSRLTLQYRDPETNQLVPRYTRARDFVAADGTRFSRCQVVEPGSPNVNKDQYDAGAPGDFVEVIVYFNHPLITPLALQDRGFIQLQARRVAINESFRTARVVSMGSEGGPPPPPPPPPPTDKLKLFTQCTHDPATIREWKVTNTNPNPVTFNWQIVGSTANGTKTVPAAGGSGPGQVVFWTPFQPTGNTLNIFVSGRLQDTKAADDNPCSPPPSQDLLKLIPQCTDNPAAVREWKVTNTNPNPVTFNWQIVSSPANNGSETVPAAGGSGPGMVTFITPVPPTAEYEVEILVSGVSQDKQLSINTPCSPPPPPPTPPPGHDIQLEFFWLKKWQSGSYLNVLKADPNFQQDLVSEPCQYPTLFESPYKNSTREFYGQRMRGHVIPPVTGTYTFYIASDDQSELYLSTNADPLNKQRIAWVNGWTAPNQWNKPSESNQKSAPISLVQNGSSFYYIEALMGQQMQGDNLSVGWTGPAPVGSTITVIPGQSLQRWPATCQLAPPTLTPTLTSTRTPTNTPTFGPSPTRTPTRTPTLTRTATMTRTPTRTPTFGPSPTRTPTGLPTLTNTPRPTNTPWPTVQPSNTPIATTPGPTRTPTSTPTRTPTSTLRPTATQGGFE